jgi:hypothetical protein|tara:strand:- start:1666 stop:2136 length:471 start_codon:yes stop_codon:yes gene_type:complete
MIRLATKDDAKAIVKIAFLFHKLSQFGGVTTYNFKDALIYTLNGIKNKNKLWMVCEKDSEVIGFFVAGKHHPPWNSNQNLSSEELFFLLPEHKSPRIALNFFKEWEKWCVSHGVVQMSFTPTSFVDDNLNRWDGFCNHIGFKKGGIYYKKVLTNEV